MMLHPIDYYIPPSSLPLYWIHCWAIFASLNYFIYATLIWPRLRNVLPHSPRLKTKYRRMFWNIVFCLNVPWFLMGIGIIFGRVGSIINFGVFWEWNMTVLIWWVLILALAMSGILWLNSGGAEELAKYPGLPMVPIGDARKIKIYLIPNLLAFPLFIVIWQNAKPIMYWLFRHPEWETRAFIAMILYMVGFLVLVLFMSLQASAWTAWATHYQEKAPFKGKYYSGQTNNWLYGTTGDTRFGFDPKALHLTIGVMNRMGRPSLSIPWADVKSKYIKTGSFRGFRITFKKAPLAPFMVDAKTAMKLKGASNRQKLNHLFPVKKGF